MLVQKRHQDLINDLWEGFSRYDRLLQVEEGTYAGLILYHQAFNSVLVSCTHIHIWC